MAQTSLLWRNEQYHAWKKQPLHAEPTTHSYYCGSTGYKEAWQDITALSTLLLLSGINKTLVHYHPSTS